MSMQIRINIFTNEIYDFCNGHTNVLFSRVDKKTSLWVVKVADC